MAEMPEATTAPDALCCPISMEIMRDPVISADGHTYERAEIESWFANNRTSPKTGAVLRPRLLRHRRAPAARAAPSTTTTPSRTTATTRTSSWGRPTTAAAGTRRSS